MQPNKGTLIKGNIKEELLRPTSQNSSFQFEMVGLFVQTVLNESNSLIVLRRSGLFSVDESVLVDGL